jgi:transcriptional regulator with XRE-family HTH domain
MPKPNGRIDQIEREIAKRVRMVRFYHQMSLPKFARTLGVSVNKIAGVEYARTPLKVCIADKISAKLDVNLIWLATGSGRMNPTIGLISQIAPEIKGNSQLSKSFDPDIKKRFLANGETAFREFERALLKFPTAPPERRNKLTELVVNNFFEELEDAFSNLTSEGKYSLWSVLDEALRRYLQDWDREQPGEQHCLANKDSLLGCKLIVDVTANPDNLSGVRSETEIPTWKQIVAALKRLTESPGAKASLAGKLNTSRQNVNKWLSGAGAPRAELTLEVFRWVEKHGGWKQK